MAAFKIRRKGLMMSGIQCGSSGTWGTQIISGSFSVTHPDLTTMTPGSAQATVSNLAANDKVFLTKAGSPALEVIVVGASPQAGVLDIDFFNTGSATAGSAALTYQYLAFRDSA